MDVSKPRHTERQYLRVRLHSEVVLRESVPPEVGRAVNISLAGMYIRVNTPRPVDSPIEIEFVLPPNRRLVSKARVVRATAHGEDDYPAGMGIAFVEMPIEAKGEIDDYVRNTTRILKAIFFELNRAHVDEKRVAELVEKSPLEHRYTLDYLRELVAMELNAMRLRPGNSHGRR